MNISWTSVWTYRVGTKEKDDMVCIAFHVGNTNCDLHLRLHLIILNTFACIKY